MKSILFALKKPADDEVDAGNRWYRASSRIADSHKPAEGIEYIGEGCLLIQSSNGLALLAIAISAAENCKVSYRVIFIEGTTEWTRTLQM